MTTPCDPDFASVSLLLHFDGDTNDSSSFANPTYLNAAFGASAEVSGGPFAGFLNVPSGNYFGSHCLAVPYTSGSPLDIFTGASWTIEGAFQITNDIGVNNVAFLFDYGSTLNGPSGYTLIGDVRSMGGGSYKVEVSNASAFAGSGGFAEVYAFDLDSWHTYAVVCDAGVTKCYVDGAVMTTAGTPQVITTWTPANYIPNAFIGTYPAPNVILGSFNGYSGNNEGYGLAEFRVSTIARYTSNYAPLSAPFGTDCAIPVPNVVGDTLADAQSALAAAGFANTVTLALSDATPGTIIAQNPAAGVSALPGPDSPVALTESAISVPEPDLSGETLATAEANLSAAGLTVVVSSAYSATIGAGLVVSQFPAVGTLVQYGTAVDITLSIGPLTVPNIVGESLAQATIDVVALGLSLGTFTSATSLTVLAGYIVSQAPAAGANANSGDAVSYVLSLGYPPVPSITGMLIADGETALTAAGFTVGTVTAVVGSAAPGVILSFSPAGSQPPGTPINVVVTAAPAADLLTRGDNINVKLMQYLHRVFKKDPLPFLALRLSCVGGLTWIVDNTVLTLTPAIVAGGMAAPLSIDLTKYTVASLAQFVLAQPGYAVLYQDTSSLSTLSALVLIEANGDTSQSNGDHLFGYTNLLWAYINTQASELGLAQQQIVNMLLQMSTTTAANDSLDLLGTYYKVPRNAGELDSSYGPRIPAYVLLPSSNNVGMQIVLQSLFPGTTAIITDAVLDASGLLLRDGSVLFNSVAVHNSLVGGDSGGLFDVLFAYDFSGALSPAAYLPLLIAAVNRYRAGGTYIRQIAFKNGLTATTLTSSSYSGSILVEVYG